MDRGRVGEDRGSKETDGCPLTKGCTLQNKGLAALFQHANDDAIIGTYKGCERVPSPPGQPRE
jgi:hypothetical protein